MAENNFLLAEFQGLYGAFTMHERVLQKIWMHRDYDGRDLRLTDGRSLRVLAPGEWNLQGGPDFLGARLWLDGQEVRGDVEVHFHLQDWHAHGHQLDPAFAGVVLHVVLYPPELVGDLPAGGLRPRLPTLVMLPRLLRGLEEYAADDALESITARDEWRRFAELGRKDPRELRPLLWRLAKERWQQKVHYAALRTARLGWDEAAHQTALEILGYKRNRAAMLMLATLYPLAAWVAGHVDPAQAMTSNGLHWDNQGTRPANLPRTRLLQYAAWVKAAPAWPGGLEQLAALLPCDLGLAETVAESRTRLRLAYWHEQMSQQLTGGSLGGTRFETLVCDGLLPLAAARTGKDLSALWFCWFLGDVPLALRQAMPKLGLVDGRTQPICHGIGQGLLGWLLQESTPQSS